MGIEGIKLDITQTPFVALSHCHKELVLSMDPLVTQPVPLGLPLPVATNVRTYRAVEVRNPVRKTIRYFIEDADRPVFEHLLKIGNDELAAIRTESFLSGYESAKSAIRNLSWWRRLLFVLRRSR